MLHLKKVQFIVKSASIGIENEITVTGRVNLFCAIWYLIEHYDMFEEIYHNVNDKWYNFINDKFGYSHFQNTLPLLKRVHHSVTSLIRIRTVLTILNV